jgi:glycerol kinase
MPFLLALDQGTTSSRALVFDEGGSIHAVAQQEFRQIYPRAGWVEHDPIEIVETQMSVARRALEDAGLVPADVAAIGITNQRETCLLWDRATGEACTNAIVWQDRRTAEMCEELQARGAGRLILEKTGLVINPYFSASKIRWMLDHDTSLRRRAESGKLAFGTIDTWLTWNLSDGRSHITDATNASRTMLYNIHSNEWDEELLDLWGIPQELLPDVADSAGIVATTTRFGEEIPIAGIAGDQQAALFGQACFAPGMTKCTFGTGCFLLMNTGVDAPVSESGLLTTIASRIGGVTEYALEGSVFMGGATIQWLRDGLGIIDHAADVEALAASVSDSDGVVLVPAFTGLGAPYWDSGARALLVGMTRSTTAAHLARAALDGIAWQVSDVVESMARDAGIRPKEIRVDGGAIGNDLLMQIQADILGIPLQRAQIGESTAFGAALLAGLGVRVFHDRDSALAAWTAERTFNPRSESTEIEVRRKAWQKAVDLSRGWV